ncbi:MAG: hypothetical protein V4592_19305 [Bacteroidota bacterium]
MEAVYKNEELLKLTAGSYYIHDAVVARFDIYQQDFKLCIDVYFASLNRKLKREPQLKIHFIDVIEYSFYYHKSYDFYNVECYKFYKTEKGYYLSLDPYEGVVGEPSEEDQDFIWCESVEGYLT